MRQLGLYFRSIKLITKVAPFRIWIDIFYSLLVNLERVFWAVFFLRFIIQSIENKQDYFYIIKSMILISLFILINRLVRAWYENFYKRESDIHIMQSLKTMMFKKSFVVERIYYNNPVFYDNYRKAVEFVDNVLFQAFNSISKMIGTLFMCISVFTVLFTIDPIGLIFLMFPLLGIFIFEKLLNKNNYELFKKQVPQSRKKDYIKQVFFERKFAADQRMTNIGDELNDEFTTASIKNISIIKKTAPKRILLSFLKEVFKNRIPFSIILIYIIYMVMVKQSIGSADVSVMLLGLVQLSDTFGTLLSDIIQIDNYANYSKFLFDFLDMQDNIEKLNIGVRDFSFNGQIVINNLSFGYTADRPVLKNINLTINKGQKIAVIGHNGAGKSTLVHMLLRIYNPDTGTIMMDGKNISDLDLTQYRKLFSCVFQDFNIFAMSIAENVALSFVKDDMIEVMHDAFKVSKLEEKIKSLPDNISSVLTKEFDEKGIEFSGGEYQRLAVARAYMKDADLLILDEPTSALDPIVEDELFNSILSIGHNKTVIYILHRLSYAKMADVILFMKDGEIIERGSHTELMKLNGYYAELYNIQSQMYL